MVIYLTTKSDGHFFINKVEKNLFGGLNRMAAFYEMSRAGFNFEDEIAHLLNAVSLTHYRENEIKKLYKSSSLNGIDHLIKIGTSDIVLVQDKWKEHVGQQEVSQYLQACHMIENLDKTKKYHRYFVSKISPTKNAKVSLDIAKAHLIVFHAENSSMLAFLFVTTLLRDFGVAFDIEKIYNCLPTSTYLKKQRGRPRKYQLVKQQDF
jgi:hypothetical protein